MENSLPVQSGASQKPYFYIIASCITNLKSIVKKIKENMYIYQRKEINLPPPKQPKVRNLKKQQIVRFFFEKQIEEMLIDDFIEKSWKFGFSEYMMIFLYALLGISCLNFSFLHGANNIVVTLSIIFIMGAASYLLNRELDFRDYKKEQMRKFLKEALYKKYYNYFYEPTNQI